MAIYTALIDANVIYAMPVLDIVLEVASTKLFRARWSDDILDEWVRNLSQNRPDIPPDKINALRNVMNQQFPGASVTGHTTLINQLDLPDPNDRHVLAAAIVGRADVIVTFNLKDFPSDKLVPFGIEAQHPDEFLNFQRTLNETLFLTCIKEIRTVAKSAEAKRDGVLSALYEAAIHRRMPFSCKHAHRLVFINETSTNTKLTKRTGWSPCGERYHTDAPQITSVVPAHDQAGLPCAGSALDRTGRKRGPLRSPAHAA